MPKVCQKQKKNTKQLPTKGLRTKQRKKHVPPKTKQHKIHTPPNQATKTEQKTTNLYAPKQSRGVTTIDLNLTSSLLCYITINF